MLVAVVIISTKTYGQQEYMITQYMYNGLSLNPAYAGIHEGISGSMLWREQWTAIEGAPSTQLISLHSPLNYRPASIGALIYRDVVGVKTEFTGYFSYSYRIRITEKTKLSMGLQFNIHNFKNDINRFLNQPGLAQQTDPNDPLYSAFLDDQIGTKWNFGTGFMLHSDRYYVGLSIPQLINRDFFKDLPGDVESSRLVRHLFVSAGYVFNTESKFVVKPNILVKAVQNAPIEFDMNMNVLVSNVLWLGVSLRSEFSSSSEKKAGPLESISGLLALQLTPQFQIGYAYDFTTTSINTNSHEIMLNYIFALPTTKILTPRYF